MIKQLRMFSNESVGTEGKRKRRERESFVFDCCYCHYYECKKITAKDRGEPSKSTQQELMVRVMDANDNSPVFDPRQYSAAIPENSSIGMSVLQVRIEFSSSILNSLE